MNENETEAEHRCGPTQAQITDALLRGDVIGSYPMCDACSARSLEMAKHFIEPPPAPRADKGAERSKPHLLHGVFDGDGLTRFRLECPYEVKGVLSTGRRCWSLDDDGEIDSLQCFAKAWVDECGAELVSFEITDPSFPIEVDVELHGPLQTPNLTLHVRPASSGDGGAPTRDPYDTLHMLDAFLAIGGTWTEWTEWSEGRDFADGWPQVIAAVAGQLDSLRADSNPPAGVVLDIAERRAATDRAEMFRKLLWDARDYLAAHIDWDDPDAGEESMVQRIDTACGDRPSADRNIVPPSAAERRAAPSPVPEEGPPTWIGRATNPDDDRFTVRALVPWGHGNGPPHNALVEVRILHATPEQREGPGK
jgi:hypothetical protein